MMKNCAIFIEEVIIVKVLLFHRPINPKRYFFIFHNCIYSPTTLPASALKLILRLWIQKRRGRNFLAYPSHQAFALPFHRDKQLSQPTPIAYYIMTYAQYPHGHTFAYRYNTPWHGRFVARSSDGFKVAKFDDSKITFRKRPFSCFSMKHFVETNLQHATLAKHEIHYVLTHPSLWAG